MAAIVIKDYKLTRTIKPTNNWTSLTPGEYNINFIEQSFVEFFNQDQLPPVPPALYRFCETTSHEAPDLDDTTFHLLHSLNFTEHMDTAIDHFMARLFKALGYESRYRAASIGQDLPFDTCGTKSSVYINVCICHIFENILVVKRPEESEDAQSQLIAAAIAAYQQNNFLRPRLGPNLTTLDEMNFLGITLIDNSPAFYKIRITFELNNSVIHGTRPVNPVNIYRHTPELPCPNSEGIKTLENRTTIIQYCEAFKACLT